MRPPGVLPPPLIQVEVGDGVGLVDILGEERPRHRIVLSPGDDASAARRVSGEHDSVTADNVRVAVLNVPYRRRLAGGRNDVLGNVEPDIGYAAIMDRALDVVDMARIDFDEGVDLVDRLPVGAHGRALGEQIFEHMLLVSAGPFAALRGLVAAGEFIKLLDVAVGLRFDRLVLRRVGVEAPDLQRMVERRAGAVAQRVVHHHAQGLRHALGVVDLGGRRRQRLPSQERAQMRDARVVRAGQAAEHETADRGLRMRNGFVLRHDKCSFGVMLCCYFFRSGGSRPSLKPGEISTCWGSPKAAGLASMIAQAAMRLAAVVSPPYLA